MFSNDNGYSKVEIWGFINGFFVQTTNFMLLSDAPARASLQHVKAFMAYNACSFCRIKGTYDGKMIFPFRGIETNRSDTAYAAGQDNNQNDNVSPLASVIRLRSDMPPDYMHIVCLGVVRRLMNYFTTTQHGLYRCKLSRQEIENLMDGYVLKLPVEFSRPIRSLKQMSYFKASEYRTWLLYAGPVLFRNCLKAEFYEHFISLHCAITILGSTRLSHMNSSAQTCIESFCQNIETLFGQSQCTFNCHCLLHLPEFSSKMGPLDTFSCFPYESFLYK